MFYNGSKKIVYEYKYVRIAILDAMRGTEEVKLITCRFEQGRNIDLHFPNLKTGAYIAQIDIYKQDHKAEDIKFVFSTYGPRKTELKFFTIPMTREQEIALTLNPHYCTPQKISEKVFWTEFIRENLDGLFQHR
jgi:hypothetical protein